jgi:hypothetical protein
LFNIVRKWSDLDDAARGSLSQVALRTAWIKRSDQGGHRLFLLCLSAAFEAIAVRPQKDLHSSETALPKKLDPADDDHGTADHRVEQLGKRPLSVNRQQVVNAPLP